jgi:hypothetical protein
MATTISGTSGVTFPAGGVGNPAGAVVGTTDTQTLTNKTLTSSGSVLVSVAASTLGYSTGVGGAVTQATSKSTAVTLNTSTGQITTSSVALATVTNVRFQINNSIVAATDTIIVNLASGFATGSTYQAWVDGVAAGSFSITLRNISAGSLSEALVINFSVIKGVAA